MKTPCPLSLLIPLREKIMQNMGKDIAKLEQNPWTAMDGAMHCIRLEKQNG